MTYPALKIEIDYATAPNAAASTWTDVTPLVVGTITSRLGGAPDLGQIEPHTGSIELRNPGTLDGSEGDGSGGLRPGRRIRVRAWHVGTTYALGYGWLGGWPTRFDWRRRATVPLEWHDLLSRCQLATLPESVWDWRCQSMTGICAWYRTGDPVVSSQAADVSAAGRHGRWSVWEGYTTPASGIDLPASVAAAGAVERVIPAATRPGRSWARMLAEVGQPAAIVGTARTISLVGHPDTAVLGGAGWAAEVWIQPRLAFPVAITGSAASTARVEQPILTWGAPEGDRWVLSLSDTSAAQWEQWRRNPVTGNWSANVAVDPTNQVLADGQAHHLAVTTTLAAGTWTTDVWVDGTLRLTTTTSTISPPPGPVVVGWATPGTAAPGHAHLESTIGDIVIWSRALTAAEILQGWRSGRWGNLAGNGLLGASDAANQTLTMAGLAAWATLTGGQGHIIDPGPLAGRTALDVLRQIAGSTDGILWQDLAGATQMILDDWPVTLTRALNVHASTVGDGSTSVTLAELDWALSDARVVNDATVSWAGGEQRAVNTASVTSNGTMRGGAQTILARPADADGLAQLIVARSGDPTIEPATLIIRPQADAEWTFCLGMQLGQRIRVQRTRVDGTVHDAEWWVMGIAHQIEPAQETWAVELTIVPADWARPAWLGGDTYRPFREGDLTNSARKVWW